MIFHTQAESDAYHAGYKAGVAARPEAMAHIQRYKVNAVRGNENMIQYTTDDQGEWVRWDELPRAMNSGSKS